MPMYKYHCSGCGHVCDIQHSAEEKDAVDCPACKKPLLQKQMMPSGLHFKGDGFYKTDYQGGCSGCCCSHKKKSCCGD